MSAGPEERIDLGIVIERREIDNPWQDYSWTPVAVIPGAPHRDAADEWLEVGRGEGWVQYHAATLELELFRGETDGYRTNLSEDQPFVYVVLTPGEEEDEPEVLPFLATVCPYEAEGYTEDSEQIVEGVPMPTELAVWVQDFIAKYHVDVKFKKRKRKPYDPRKEGFDARKPRGGSRR